MRGYAAEYMCFVEGPPLQCFSKRRSDVCIQVVCRYDQQISEFARTPSGNSEEMVVVRGREGMCPCVLPILLYPSVSRI
jgi:hypothetical protein